MQSFILWMNDGHGCSLVTASGSVMRMDMNMIVVTGTVVIVSLCVVMLFARMLGQRKKALDELKRTSEELRHMAEHDSLTGLKTRHVFLNGLQQQMIDNNHPYIALMVLDILNLRTINDAYSHEIGDRVLIEIAGLLSDTFNEEVSMIGMNHTDFLVAYSGGSHVNDIHSQVQSLLNRLNNGIIIDHMEIAVKVNIGISLAPEHSLEANLLFKKANMACMEAGRSGHSQYSIFKSDIYRNALKRIALEKQLRRAVERNEFEVYYQPRIDLIDGSICGCEALIRWNHPEKGIVYPGQFIGIAEKHGFIRDITRWVIRTVIRQTLDWSNGGHRIKVSFNVSGKEFDDDFVTMMSDLMKQEQGDPSLLEVEITETATLKDMDHSKVMVELLQRMGITVALDDFGTGYSSMTYIKKLNANKLKIDRSFIEDIEDYQQRAVVESMIELGKKLDYCINVEGVETREQLRILEKMTVDEVQGWYFSKAVKADALMDYIRSHDYVAMKG